MYETNYLTQIIREWYVSDRKVPATELKRIHKWPIKQIKNYKSHRESYSGLFVYPISHFVWRHCSPSLMRRQISFVSRSSRNWNRRYMVFNVNVYQLILTAVRYFNRWNWLNGCGKALKFNSAQIIKSFFMSNIFNVDVIFIQLFLNVQNSLTNYQL